MKKIGKIVLIAFAVLVVLGALSSACSSSSPKSGQSGDIQATSSSATSDASDAVSSIAAEAKEDKDGFDAKTNYTVTVAGVEFQLPDYYEQGEPKTSDSGAITTLYTAESSTEAGVFIMSFEQSVPGGKAENYEKSKDELAKGIAGMNGVLENMEVSEQAEKTIGGISGMTFSASATMKGTPMEERGILYWNDELKSIGALVMVEGGDYVYDYHPDFEKTVNSAKAVEVSDEASQSEQGDSGEVSPDLKEMLDSYEAFMDEYVEFMAEYKDSDDTMGMLQKYSDYMQKYADFAEKVDQVDTDDMSAADYAYYIEVTSRVSQKLLQAM